MAIRIRTERDYRRVARPERSIAEVAALLGVSPATASRWLRKYDLPRRAVGNRRCGGAHVCSACGTAREFHMDALGRTVAHCAACERRRLRICLDCPRRVNGRAWRCAEHAARAAREEQRRYRQCRREELCAKTLARIAKESPQQRAHRLAVKKAWRKRNKLRITLTTKRKQRLEGRGGYRTREAYLAYHRAYNRRYGSNEGAA